MLVFIQVISGYAYNLCTLVVLYLMYGKVYDQIKTHIWTMAQQLLLRVRAAKVFTVLAFTLRMVFLFPAYGLKLAGSLGYETENLPNSLLGFLFV